jgi:hypothetical protein
MPGKGKYTTYTGVGSDYPSKMVRLSRLFPGNPFDDKNEQEARQFVNTSGEVYLRKSTENGILDVTSADPSIGKIDLKFSLFERHLNCKGVVVWRAESTVTHPRGVGIKFESLDKDTLFCLKQAAQKLRKLARVYNQMNRERNWQEYLDREKAYQDKRRSLK